MIYKASLPYDRETGLFILYNYNMGLKNAILVVLTLNQRKR